MEIIKSISNSQDEILQGIIKLYCPNGFDLDPTYSKGVFYKTIPQPKYKSDIIPLFKDVMEHDCRNLPYANNELQSIIYDPPFTAGSQADGKPGIIKTRFNYERTVPELWNTYRDALDEFERILVTGGFLIVKCQDTIDGGKQYLSHIELLNYAYRLGFYLLDIFILVRSHVLIRTGMIKQYHARKYHCYFLVLKKAKSKVFYTSNTWPQITQ